MSSLRNLCSRRLWYDSINVLTGIIAVIASFITIVGFGLVDVFDGTSWWMRCLIMLAVFFVILILTAIVKARLSSRQKVLTIRGIKVTIKQGDIFQSQGWKLIPFNEFYDTEVNDVVIARNSLNGKYILEHVSNITALRERISQEKNIRIVGKRTTNGVSFPLGHIIGYNGYMLLAFSHFKNNQAKLSHLEYELCLRNMWHEISRVYANQPISIPLLGSGITRFEDISEVNETHLLQSILVSLKNSTAQINQPITIILTKETINRINLYDINKLF